MSTNSSAALESDLIEVVDPWEALNDTETEDYDYYDVSERAARILIQPEKIVALVLGFIALLANIFSMIVICKLYNGIERHSSHVAFILSLGASDMLFCLSVVLHIINKVVNPLYYPAYGPYDKRLQSRCAYFVIKCLNTTAINMTLLNLTGMAVDHYVAILKPLHYQRILSKRRYIMMILAFWTIALICGFSDFLSVFPDWDQWQKYSGKFNLCEFVFLSPYQEEYTVFPIAGICLCTMVFSYVRIYFEVRKHQQRGPAVSEIQRSKKALATTLLILGTFMLCWLPMCLFQITLIIQVHVNPDAVHKLLKILMLADQHLYNLLLLNALVDPIIYAFRIGELRQGYIIMLSKICICYHLNFKTFPRITWKKRRESTVSYICVENGKVYRSRSNKSSRSSCGSITTTKSRIPSSNSAAMMPEVELENCLPSAQEETFT